MKNIFKVKLMLIIIKKKLKYNIRSNTEQFKINIWIFDNYHVRMSSYDISDIPLYKFC